MLVDCPICGAKPFPSIHDRPCRCGWTELTMPAVERLTRERDEARSLLRQYELVMTADDHQIVRDLADAQQVGRAMRDEVLRLTRERDEVA